MIVMAMLPAPSIGMTTFFQEGQKTMLYIVLHLRGSGRIAAKSQEDGNAHQHTQGSQVKASLHPSFWSTVLPEMQESWS